MTGSPTVSVIIVNFNTKDRTLECLRSLMDQRIAGLDVVLVDNGSVDGSAEAIRAAWPAVTVIEAQENLGFARGVNRGVAASDGEYVLLLNPDTTVLPGSLESLVQFAVEHPSHGVYGGRTLRPDGRLDPSSCWGSPTLWSLFCFATGLSTILKGSRVFDPESLGGWQRDTVREVAIVTGCLLLVRRDDWQRIGGMDELFFLYGEDAEFSLRAARMGLRPAIVPSATIIHDVGTSTASGGQKVCMVMAGKVTLAHRQRRPMTARLAVAMLLIGTGLRAALENVPRSRGTMWSTVWSRRDDWRGGYPRAEATLFGRPLAKDVA